MDFYCFLFINTHTSVFSMKIAICFSLLCKIIELLKNNWRFGYIKNFTSRNNFCNKYSVIYAFNLINISLHSNAFWKVYFNLNWHKHIILVHGCKTRNYILLNIFFKRYFLISYIHSNDYFSLTNSSSPNLKKHDYDILC